MGYLRTARSQKKYLKLIADGYLANGCQLCKKKRGELIKDFKYWKIVKNKFPYDRIARVHHMITLQRHVTEKELNAKEKRELESIREKYIERKYEYLINATRKNRSIPEHFHTHLIILKDKI